MLLLVLVLIRTALIDEWRSQVPDDAANHFVMNIAEDEVEGVRALVRDQATEGEFLFPISVSCMLLLIQFLHSYHSQRLAGGL